MSRATIATTVIRWPAPTCLRKEIEDGVVEIAVSEGRYHRIELQNDSRLREHLAQGLLAPLETGEVIESRSLSRTLLLLSDIPGLEVSTALAPGDESGTSDLLVTLEDGPVVQGLIDIDNHGNRFTGPIRRGLRVDVPNPRGYGDLLSLRVLDTGSGLVHGRIAYEGPVDAGPTRLGVSTALVDYQLGEELAVLGAEGQARVNSLYLRYPIIRTADANLTIEARHDGKQMEDRILGAVTQKQANVATLRLGGERSTETGRGGVSSFSVDVVSGNLTKRYPSCSLWTLVNVRTSSTRSRRI